MGWGFFGLLKCQKFKTGSKGLLFRGGEHNVFYMICFKRFLLLTTVVLVGSFFACNGNACISNTNKKFYVEKYGAVGDGKTNDIAAFQALTRDVNANGGGIVVFPKGKVFCIAIEDDYSCGHKSRPDDGAMAFAFEHCKKVVVDMNGSTIQLTSNHSTKYAFFYFFDCANYSLSNGSLKGDVVEHDYTPVIYKGKVEETSHQWGYGVFIRGSKGVIKDMDISCMTGDGIYFGSVRLTEGIFHAKVTINGCEISYCRRNGISCASSLGFELVNTQIHHIGDWVKTTDMPIAIIGCKPKAGIDFEYEGKADDVGNVEISGCSFFDCTEYCIVTSNSSRPETTNFTITDSEFYGSTVHSNNLTSRGKKEIKNCRFYDAPAFFGDANVYQCTFEMGVVINYVSRTSFYDCVFNGHLEKLDSEHGCFLAGTNPDKTLFQRCKFKNIKGYNDSTPAFQGFSGYVHPINIDFVSCDFDNCSFVVSKKKFDSSLSFDGCRLKNGCLIHNMSTEAMLFENSELYDVDSYVTQNGVFVMNNCKIVQEDESLLHPLLAFGTHTMNNCIIIDKVGITPYSTRQYGVRGYRINANNSEIQLDNPTLLTKGLYLKGCKLTGVKATEFQGKQEDAIFR